MIENLFTYLIFRKRIPPGLLAVPTPLAVASSESPRCDVVLTPDRALARIVLSRVRGDASDEDLWEAWRFFTRELGDFIWLTGLTERPDLNGSRGLVVSFDAGTVSIGVKIATGETLLIPTRNLSWCPLVPDVDAVAGVLAKVMDPEAVRRVYSELACKRCTKPCVVGSRCEVPHPKSSMKILVGKGEQGLVTSIIYLCDACGGRFRRRVMEVEGVGHCWEGKHTSVQLPWLDGRRMKRHEYVALPGCRVPDEPSLRQRIETLNMPDTVTFLEIVRPHEDRQFSLDCAFPNLEKLSLLTRHCDSYPYASGVIKIEVFPALEKLFLRTHGANPWHACPRPVCAFNSSSLKMLNVGPWKGFEEDIEDLLDRLPALEELTIELRFGHEPYPAPTGGESLVRDLPILSLSVRRLHFLGNHKPHFVKNLKLWTPSLMVMKLDFQSGHENPTLPPPTVLGELTWLENHPLEKELRDGHVRPPLFVSTIFLDGSLESIVKDGLRTHPDVSYASELSSN